MHDQGVQKSHICHCLKQMGLCQQSITSKLLLYSKKKKQSYSYISDQHVQHRSLFDGDCGFFQLEYYQSWQEYKDYVFFDGKDAPFHFVHSVLKAMMTALALER